MSKHVVKFELSVSSVENALKELERYSKRFMVAADIFAMKLATLGVKQIDETIAGNSAHDENASMEHSTTYRRVEGSGTHVVYEVVLFGSQVLFIEFGAGVYWNDHALHSSIHPKGAELGYTIGDYGMGQGAKNVWAYREGGEWFATTGQRAACAIPAAMNMMRQNILNAAQEAWRQAG